MRKIYFVFTLVLAAFHFASAQSAQSVYFELAGPVGFSNVVSSGSSVIYLPLGINYLLGKDKKHYFEIGGGVTPVFNSINANPEGDSAITETFAHLVLGYRFQPINKGFTFRAFMCPIYGNGIFIPYYAGISGGYKF